MASMLNCGVLQTTTPTASAEPIQVMMNSMIASNMKSMQRTMQSQNLTSTAGFNAQQSLSASTECRTPKITEVAVVTMNNLKLLHHYKK